MGRSSCKCEAVVSVFLSVNPAHKARLERLLYATQFLGLIDASQFANFGGGIEQNLEMLKKTIYSEQSGDRKLFLEARRNCDGTAWNVQHHVMQVRVFAPSDTCSDFDFACISLDSQKLSN